jgi:hypothetical protein
MLSEELHVSEKLAVRFTAQDKHENNDQHHHHHKLIDLERFGGPQNRDFGWNEVPGRENNSLDASGYHIQDPSEFRWDERGPTALTSSRDQTEIFTGLRAALDCCSK